MYPETLYPKTRQVLENIKKLPVLSDFYLAGGTALALQLGHRKSVDLDFFSANFPKRDLILQALRPFNPQITHEVSGTIDVLIDEVKVSFLEYNYALIEDLKEFEDVKIASVIDIACMKLSATSSRGSKKDFIDLYVILQNFSLEELFSQFEKKFMGVSYQKLILLKSLTYFADAETEPDPDYTESLSWTEIKKTIEDKVKNYLQKETF